MFKVTKLVNGRAGVGTHFYLVLKLLNRSRLQTHQPNPGISVLFKWIFQIRVLREEYILRFEKHCPILRPLASSLTGSSWAKKRNLFSIITKFLTKLHDRWGYSWLPGPWNVTRTLVVIFAELSFWGRVYTDLTASYIQQENSFCLTHCSFTTGEQKLFIIPILNSQKTLKMIPVESSAHSGRQRTRYFDWQSS